MYLILFSFRIRPPSDRPAAIKGAELLAEMQHLYSLMCALLKFPDTATFEDERTAVALHLMEYLEKQVLRGG
jgi:hypothetical protein